MLGWHSFKCILESATAGVGAVDTEQRALGRTEVLLGCGESIKGPYSG